MLVDSHCHLTDDRYQDDRWDVLARAHSAGVIGVVTVCSDARDTSRILKLLEEGEEKDGVPALWGTAGIHPHEADKASDGDMELIGEVAANQPRIVAIGETGLDFFYDLSDRAAQEALFRLHFALAASLDLPLVVHSRSADALTAEILREWGGKVRGVLHCFTGGDELLQAALEVGWMVSFTGIISFKKYDGVERLKKVPRDRLMVETDGPYLAPIPHRGKRNEPAFVASVAEKMAAIRGEELVELQRYTTENARHFFSLDF